MTRDPNWQQCQVHADMIRQEGAAAWRADERAQLLVEQRMYWADTAFELQALIGTFAPAEVQAAGAKLIDRTSKACKRAASRRAPMTGGAS